MKYNYIGNYVDGVAVANLFDNNTRSIMWGIIDKDGNQLSEFKYNYVEPWGEGYYKCEIGSRKNILRKDGSEVLKVWFNYVYKVKKGVFIIENTIRKTKDHPTLYVHGLASVNGDILFPPIFDKLKWNNEVLLDFFYAEKNGKPYLITDTGFIIDPAGDHLPKPMNRIDNFAWDGPKDTICDGCIFADSINIRGEGCGKLPKEDFRNNVIKGSCKHYKHDELALSYQEKRDKYQEEKTADKQSKETDEFATKLAKDFIKDKLDGDVMQLTSFDFEELRGDEKYGDCGGYCFSPEKTRIVKAIMTLTFKNVWPEVSYDGFDHYDYEVADVNTYTMLLGVPLGETFKGLRNFRPSAELLDRAWAFRSLCHTIGNYTVWPGGIAMCREKLRRNQRYIDTYLQVIHYELTSLKKSSSDLQTVINRKKKAFTPYRSDEGFAEMCKKMYLGDYLDQSGKPKALFYGVWSDQKDLTREYYFQAIEQYFDFCETEIVKRSKMIAECLMKALGMGSSVADSEEILTIQLPTEFEVLPPLPEDPDGSLSYGKDTSGSTCIIQSYPIQEDDAMPMDDTKPIIDGIHKSLGDRQGLIEVSNGTTRYSKKYVYSIVKNGRPLSGIDYILTMHLVKGGKALCVKGQFEERGKTGIRETTVYEYAIREKLITDIGGEGWMKDPYDENYKHGLLMNLSEEKKHDHSFPRHPLSELRRLIAYIIDNN